MKRLLAIICSLALTLSMFSMPALAAQSGNSHAQNAADTNNAITLDDLSESSEEGIEDSTESEGSVEDQLSADGISDSDLIALEEEEEESDDGFFAQVMGFFASLNPFAASHEKLNGASVEVRFMTLVPKASENYSKNLQLKIEGSSYSSQVAFQERPLSFEDIYPGISAPDYGEGIGKPTPTTYVARINGVPAGTYRASVIGTNFADYTHGHQFTVNDGEMARFSLVDNLASESVNSAVQDATNHLGLIPYGDYNIDNSMTNSDTEFMVDRLSKATVGDPDAYDSSYDYDGNGVVDLRDMQLFATTVNKTSSARSTKISVDASQMKTEPYPETDYLIGGSNQLTDEQIAESLFNDDGKVVDLTPVGNSAGVPTPINNDHPVGLNLGLKRAEIEGLVLNFPKDENGHYYNMPTSGELYAEFYEEGNEANESFHIDKLFSDTTEPLTYEELLQVRKNTTVTLDKVHGRLIIDFTKPVEAELVRLVFFSTSDTESKVVSIDNIQLIKDMSELSYGDFQSLPLTPQALSANATDSSLDLSWEPSEGAFSYDVEIASPESMDVYTTAATSLEVIQHSSKALVNGTEYSMRVRANNLDGSSTWSPVVTATPISMDPPQAPNAPVLESGYSQISASWSPVENATSYNVMYRPANKSVFETISVDDNSVVIDGLDHMTSYDICVQAVNEYGASDASQISSVVTVDRNGKVPWFSLYNRTVQDDAAYPAGKLFDLSESSAQAASIVDGNYNTYVTLSPSGTGPVVALANPIDMKTLAFTTYLGEGYASDVSNVYITVNGTPYDASDGITWRTIGEQGGSIAESRNTYMVVLPQAISNVESVAVNFERSSGPATISELALYEYNGMDQRIDALWLDESHVKLRDDVTFEDIDYLKALANEADPDSAKADHQAEVSPFVNEMNARIEAARAVLTANEQGSSIGSTIVFQAPKGNVDGTSDLIPLGVAAKAGSLVDVYVGSASHAFGQPTDVELVACQHNGAAKSYSQTLCVLKAGLNEVMIPDIEVRDVEPGCTLYVRYTGSSQNQQYAFNVSGATKIPVLDLGSAGTVSPSEMKSRVRTYVEQLKAHVNDLVNMHKAENHKVGSSLFASYDEKLCVSNATEIMTDHVLLSVPASQVLAGLSANSTDQMADQLLASLLKLDEMVEVSYQNKGLFDVDENPYLASEYGIANDSTNLRHNIRYAAMADGMYMYAEPTHIGIRWEEVAKIANLASDDQAGIFSQASDKADVLWALGHELGHQIDQGCTYVPEISNNYYAMLASSANGQNDLRFDYQDVYNRVTSGVAGALPSDIGHAMYWQLHLAYDKDAAATAYADANDQMESLVFARINAYARNPQCAPYGLELDGANADNALMRTACAATQRNLLGFFEAWGLVPDEGTVAYASNFPTEQRDIQYINDVAKAYATSHPLAQSVNDQSEAADASFTYDSQTGAVRASNIRFAGLDEEGIIGFELLCNLNGGQSGTLHSIVNVDDFEVVGFAGKGTSEITTIAPYAQTDCATYFIRALDSTFSYSQATNIGTVQIEKPTAYDKSKWVASATMRDTQESAIASACDAASVGNANAVIDGNIASTFIGAYETDEEQLALLSDDPARVGARSITVAFNDEVDFCGIRLYPGAKNRSFKGILVEVSSDGKNWVAANASTLYMAPEGNYPGFDAYGDCEYADIYFGEDNTASPKINSQNFLSYKASYMRITERYSNTMPISLAEIELLRSPVGR